MSNMFVNSNSWNNIGKSQGLSGPLPYYRKGGPITSYWTPPPPPPYAQFVAGFGSSGIGCVPVLRQSEFYASLPPFIPIQAFHAEFPNFVPNYTGTGAPYFPTRTSWSQFPVGSSGASTSHQAQPEYLTNSVELDRKPKFTMRVKEENAENQQIPQLANPSTCIINDKGILKEAGNSRLHDKELNAIEVKLRLGNKRGPLFDIKIPELHSTVRVQTPKSVYLDCAKNISEPSYAPKLTEQKSGKSFDGVSVKQEFQRKVKEAAKTDLTCGSVLPLQMHSNASPDQKVLPLPVCTSASPDPQEEMLTFKSPMYKVPREADFEESNVDIPDEVDSGLSNTKYTDKEIRKSPNVEMPSSSTRLVPSPLGYSIAFNLNNTSDFEPESPKQIDHVQPGNESKALNLFTDSSPSEADDFVIESRQQPCCDDVLIPTIVAEFRETTDWKNTRWRINNCPLFNTSAVEFVLELALHVIKKSETHWHKVGGTILRLMLKTRMADKKGMLKMFAKNFIDEPSDISGMDCTFILPRFVRVLAEAFFNEGNLNWLVDLRLYSLQTKLDEWEMLANLVGHWLAARTNMDFVYNLVQQTQASVVNLAEILPLFRDPDAIKAIEAPPSIPVSSTKQQHSSCFIRRHLLPSVSSYEIREASKLLDSFSLSSENVKYDRLTKPLFVECLALSRGCTEQESRDEVVRQNVYFLANMLRHYDEVKTLLQHYEIISSKENRALSGILSVFTRFVVILATVLKKDEHVLSKFLTILRFTDNVEVADILGVFDACA